MAYDMKGRTKHMFDAEAAITLRKLDDGAEAATAAEAAISLGALTKGEDDGGEIPYDSRYGATAVVHVSVMDTAAGDYTVEVEIADDEAFTTNAVVVASMKPVALGQYGLKLDPETMKAVANEPKWLRVKLTVAAGGPITYGCWLN
ncbi:MAG: hypothetical protein DSY80_04175 [Desulfocapsa sp.]|nr:MAG: hypothetical protein DSY80_04175 [Desulfocapsa sp.]